MKLLVTGSREGHRGVVPVLDKWVLCFGIPELVVLGDARGVDAQAHAWVIARNLPHEVHVAKWLDHGKRAGMLRNAEMVKSAGTGAHCIGFPVGESRGTRGCMVLSRKAGLIVTEVGP